MQHTKDAGTATVTMHPPTVTVIPDVITQPELPTQTTVQTKERRKPHRNAMYDKIGYSVALIFAVVIGAWMWYLGALYTLKGLAFFGINATNVVWWFLPLAITAAELWLLPKKTSKPLMIIIFLAVLSFDILTSWHGLIADLAGKSLPLAAGITLPKDGTVMHIMMIVLSLSFAFMPEKLFKTAINELKEQWL